MKIRNAELLEIKRQLFHLILGLFISVVVYFFRSVYGNLILVPLLAGVLMLVILPKIAPELKISNHLLYHFEREHDVMNFPFKGAIWFGIGITVPIVLIADVNVACAIIIILSVGDSFSTVIGKFHGRLRIGQKSIEGFLAFVVSSFFFALIFISSDPLLAIKFALLGGILEFFALVDDNLMVPIGLTVFYLAFI